MSAKHPLRVAVVGCGRIARGVHLPLLRASNDFRLIAVAESHGKTRTDLDLPPNVSSHAGLDELLRNRHGELDAVFVCTPPEDHLRSLDRILAESGVAVYVEKPLAPTLAEAREAAAIVTAREAAETIVTVGYNYRFEPGVATLRARSAEPGRPAPLWLRTRFTTARRKLPAWKRKRATGGGALLDLGSHHLDLLHLLTGREPVAVSAEIVSRETEHDLAAVTVDWGEGLLSSSLFAFGSDDRDVLEIGSDAGTLALDRLRSPRVTESPSHHEGENARRVLEGGRRLLDDGLALARLRRNDPLASYRRAFTAFAQAVRGEGSGESLGATLADGVRVARLVEAAERSAREGRRVSLSAE